MIFNLLTEGLNMATSNGEPGILEILRNIVVTYKGVAGDGVSLADVAKITRVEPITLISSSLSGNKELYNVLHGVLNIYAGYYLQAVHILSAELNDVRILKIMDKTNPDRDMKTLLAAGYTAYEDNSSASVNVRSLSLENAKFKLPSLDPKKVATEHIFDEDQENALSSSTQKLQTFDKLGSAVGKVLEVKFNTRPKCATSASNNEVTLTVVVKLDNMIVPSDVVSRIMVSNKDEITLGSRFKDAISGRIRFIKDFLMCSDLIKEQKKTMMKDTTGYYTTMLKRVNNSKMYSALSGNISLAGISSILVISEQDELEIQKAIGGKLTNQKTRDMVFDNTSAMMIVVIDDSWGRVSIYVRDVDGFSQNDYDSFKHSTDKNNNNIGDILKAFSVGSAPSF